MIAVWHGQVRVLLRAPARFRRLVPPWGASSPAPSAPRYRHQDARVPVPCRRRGAPKCWSHCPPLNPSRHQLPAQAAPAADPPRPATVWTRARRSGGVWSGGWLRRCVVGLRHHAPQIQRVDGPAGAPQAPMLSLHAARGHARWPEPAPTLPDVAWGGARINIHGL